MVPAMQMAVLHRMARECLASPKAAVSKSDYCPIILSITLNKTVGRINCFDIVWKSRNMNVCMPELDVF